MVPKKKRVRDLKRTGKDSRFYREQIEVGGWVPYVVCDATGAYWDGLTVIDRNGQLFTALSDAGRKQMINTILDGYFGEELKDALVDQGQFWKIQDDLITRPNQEVIAKEALRVLQVIRRT